MVFLSTEQAASLPRAWGPPLGTARLKATPEDFLVEEQTGLSPCGDGEHLWLWVEKWGLNTAQVARALAEAAGIHPRAVSFAGLKDKHALTRQWFSLQSPGRSLPLGVGEGPIPGVRILIARRHHRKLRTGALKGNRFVLTLRDCDADPAAVAQRLYRISTHGVPNYFGHQRFGRGGGNLAQASAWFAGGRPPRDRKLRGLLLSSVRSELFNRVLARRVEEGGWNRLLPGEVAMLDGRGAVFETDPADPALPGRCARLEIHPTGPLAGERGVQPGGEVAALEQSVLATEPLWRQGLARARMEAARRALRLRVADLAWHWPAPGQLRLSFRLPAGAYATVVVREVLEC